MILQGLHHEGLLAQTSQLLTAQHLMGWEIMIKDQNWYASWVVGLAPWVWIFCYESVTLTCSDHVWASPSSVTFWLLPLCRMFSLTQLLSHCHKLLTSCTLDMPFTLIMLVWIVTQPRHRMELTLVLGLAASRCLGTESESKSKSQSEPWWSATLRSKCSSLSVSTSMWCRFWIMADKQGGCWRGRLLSYSSSKFICARRSFAIWTFWVFSSMTLFAASRSASICFLLRQTFGTPAGWTLWPGWFGSERVGVGTVASSCAFSLLAFRACLSLVYLLPSLQQKCPPCLGWLRQPPAPSFSATGLSPFLTQVSEER